MGEIMSTIYLLFVVLIDSEGYESMNRVNDANYHSMFECHVAKSHHKESENIKFFCGDEQLYFNKQQKLY